MKHVTLRADCRRCAGLCCAALAFDRSDLFAFDKPAGTPCLHLAPNADRSDFSGHACSIHGELGAAGFAGCAAYDCYGAGQRVTQELFGGRSWQREPALATPMFDAFRALREVHELVLLLAVAARLPLSDEQARRREGLLARLAPPLGWSSSELALFERGTLAPEVREFLRSLREQVPSEWRARRRLPVASPERRARS